MFCLAALLRRSRLLRPQTRWLRGRYFFFSWVGGEGVQVRSSRFFTKILTIISVLTL